jgi:hypothetical protein
LARDERQIEDITSSSRVGVSTFNVHPSFASNVISVVTSFVLVRVISWIVLAFWTNGTIHEITRTKHEPKYFRLTLDVTFEAKRYIAGSKTIVNRQSKIINQQCLS